MAVRFKLFLTLTTKNLRVYLQYQCFLFYLRVAKHNEHCICNSISNVESDTSIYNFIGASTLFLSSALQELGGNRQLHSIALFHPHVPNDFTQTRLDDPLSDVHSKVQQAEFADFVHLHQGDAKQLGVTIGQAVWNHTLRRVVIFYYIIFTQNAWEEPRFLIDTEIKNNPHFEYTQLYISPLNCRLWFNP